MSPIPKRRTPASGANPPASLLVRVLRENLEGGAWHGPSVRQALRDVDARAARWRPGPGRHNVWEIVLHLAYTRHRVIGRLTGRPYAHFPRSLEAPWWPSVPVLGGDTEWTADVNLLRELHERLIETVERLPASRLATRRRGRKDTLAMETLGVATHDAYHAGQMQLIRRIAEQRTRRSAP